MASKPAPGDLEKVRRFVNTRNIESGSEELASPGALARWFQEAGLAGADIRVTAADLRLALDVREALRTVLLANNDGPEDEAALETLNRATETAKFSLVFSGPHDVEYEPRAKGGPGAIGRLLSVVADSMSEGSWTRMKACSSDECHWAFYDHARNRSGKWCEMAVCGNRMKARTYRARAGDST